MKIDPYSDNQAVVYRLLQEWATHGNIVIGVDQDDTIFDYHGKGFIFPRTWNLLKKAQDMGAILCSWTADDREDYIRDQWKLRDLHMDYFNKSPIDCGKISKKPYFNLLLDDRAGLSSALDILEQTLIDHTEYILEKES